MVVSNYFNKSFHTVESEDNPMATMEEKMGAFTKLLQDGILTPDEFAKVVAALNGNSVAETPTVEKSPLEKQYDEVFSNHIINAFKSPASCKWPALESNMIKKGSIKINSRLTECTYIETYIDAPNSYGAMLRKKIRLVMNDEGKIIRALHELQTSGVTLLGAIANAANKDNWTDIVKF